MDWRLKCVAHHLLRYAPRFVYRTLQRHITGRHLFTVSDRELAAYGYHVENFGKLKSPARAMEFGAGSNLLAALLLSASGAEEVLAFDLSRIATIEQVNHVIKQLRGRIPGPWPEISDLDGDLLKRYRIRYLAPGDARATGLAKSSVDFFCSTSTLEHIPAESIEAILAECLRIATPQALFSFIIDYHDHYSTADRSITRVNFYRYSDLAWWFFNPVGHFQNRLRHSDYENLLRAARLVLLENRRIITPIDIDRSMLDERFKDYSDDDLSALNGMFLLRL